MMTALILGVLFAAVAAIGAPLLSRQVLGARFGIDTIKLPPFNNVAANSLANVDLSPLLGQTIHSLRLQMGGTFTKAQMTSIQLKANGKTIIDTTGSRMDSRMQYRSLTATAAQIVIDFMEWRARSKGAWLSGAFDTTVGVKNLRLEIQIGAATSPTLAGFATVSPPITDPAYQQTRGLIARVHTVTQTIGAAGTFPLVIPHMDPLQGGSIFKRIAFFSANMTGLQVFRNGILVHESTKTDNDFRSQYEGQRTPQASLYPFDPIIPNLQEDEVFDTRPASGCQTAQVFGTFSAGETITTEVEVLEPLDVY
jgi:hypothetical protein